MAERVTTLEANYKAINDRIARMEKTLTELRDIMIGAKGARWVIATTVSIVGLALGALEVFLRMGGK